MEFEVAALCTVILMCAPPSDSANVKSCEGDHECADAHYCYTHTNTCAPCTDCEAYKRKGIEWNRCVKHPSKCGECLDGFVEEILTQGKVRDLCIPQTLDYTTSKRKGKHDDGEDGFSGSPHWWVSIIAGVFIVTSVTVTYHFTKKRLNRTRASSRADSEMGFSEAPSDRPPPYTPHSGSHLGYDMPSAPPAEKESPLLRSARNSTIAPEMPVECHSLLPRSSMSSGENVQLSEPIEGKIICEKERNLMAVPFVQPDYMNDISTSPYDENTEDSGGDPTDSPPASPIRGDESADEGLILHDENTVPSDWTPYPNGQVHTVEVYRETEEDSDCYEGPSAKRERTEQSINISLQQTIFLNNGNQNQNINT